jgi:hypothetical protein
MEREFLGAGWEHRVYASRNPDWVLKKPSNFNIVSINLLLCNRYRKIEEEMAFNIEECRLAGIRTPETRIFPFGRGYVMAQRRIDEDRSLTKTEIEKKILDSRSAYVYDLFQINPENFTSHGGEVYLIDLTMGSTRIDAGIFGYGIQNHIKASVIKFSRSRIKE